MRTTWGYATVPFRYYLSTEDDPTNLFFHGLQLPIGKTSPEPFKWTKTEMPKPYMTEDDLKKPNCCHYII